MSTFLADPTVFSAYALATDIDDDLRRGTHIRLFPSSRIGFPLAPFALWDLAAVLLRHPPFAWFDLRGNQLAALDLDMAEGEAGGWMTAPLPEGARLIGAEAKFHAGPGEIAIRARIQDRIIAARSIERHLAGAPAITHLRLKGRGPVDVWGWVVKPDRILERIVGSEPFGRIGLPLDGDAPWYANGEDPEVAWQRVSSGAPRRWTRPDRPDGPFDPLGRAAEEARVAVFRQDLDFGARRLVGDQDVAPSAAVVVHEWPATVVDGTTLPWQQATVWVQNALLLKGLDTGAGRYLGLMTVVGDLPKDGPLGQPTAKAWVTAGVFACSTHDHRRLPPPDALEGRLLERLISLFPELPRVIDLARERRMEVRALVAPALAAPPPDLLGPPDVRLGPARWLREKEGPSTSFRQQFLITSPPLAALAALGRLEATVWNTRHEMLTLEAGADPSQRAATRFLGRRESLVDGSTGLVDDTNIPAAGAPWTYRLAMSDVFGRFGAPAEIPVPLPPRPLIPQPALQMQLHAVPAAVHSGPASPGKVSFRIPVPAVEDLTAGSIPLARAIVAFDGASSALPTPQAGGELQFEFDLPLLTVMEIRRLPAHAQFEDTEGNRGPEAMINVDVADPRAPEIPKTGIGIIWTSRPGASEDVEFRLAFQGVGGARYRVYLSDARGLDITTVAAGPDGDRPRTRAEIAVDGANRGLAGLGMRDRFRLITEPALEPRPDGTVLLDSRLPRALEMVQFLRFVPLSARGVEAAFDTCPLLPIAVPSDRRPPAPRIETQLDPETGAARVKVIAEGLDMAALQAAEPGLFGGAPAAAARRPTFRLRRASGTVPDAIYAREIARGELTLDGESAFAEVVDPPAPGALLPFVRYFYWAEVQMPPERRIPADVAEVPVPAGAILPTEARQREDAPGAFSLSSAPAFCMRVPPEPPALAPESIEASVRTGTPGMSYILDVQIQGGPILYAKAIGSYSVRLHIQEDGGNLRQAAEADLTGGQLTWSTERPAAGVPQVRVAAILIDPIGRGASPVFVNAVQA